jgi:predicted DNA-binding transcriptional regulator AlpA
MISIMGKEFLTDKEASARYGYSQAWFIKARSEKYGPKYVQMKEHGRVLYPLEETDKWFKNKMDEKE